MSPLRIDREPALPAATQTGKSDKRTAPKRPSLTILAVALLPALIGLQGCASLTHYNAQRDLDGAPGTRSEAILMDAKQRGVYTITRTEKDADGKVVKAFQSFCAEPSPDALSNLAAQFGAQVSIAAKGEGSINGGFAEGAANIGLRTTSIQILRDITYRQCEAYANGGISRLGLETLQRRFQSTMVALLSIEQLTGAVRAPAVVLSGRAMGSDAELIATLTEKTVAARSATTRAEADMADKDKAATDTAATAKSLKDAFDKELAEVDAIRPKSPQTDAEKKRVGDFDAARAGKEKVVADAAADAAKAGSELAATRKTLTERKETLDAMTAARDAALAAGGQATTTGEIRPIVVHSTLDSESAIAVSKAVTDIVRDTLSLGYGREVCTSIIGDQTDPGRAELLAEMAARAAANHSGKSAAAVTAIQTASQSVLGKCLDLIGADADYHAKLGSHIDAKNELIKTVSESIKECTKQKACAESTEALKALTSALKIAAEMQIGASPVLLTTSRP